jgi:hypothetical protein
MTDCPHTVTRRHANLDDRKSYCVACDEPVMDVDPRECGDCYWYRPMRDLSTVLAQRCGECGKHTMIVTSTMHVTFHIAKGTCWEPK